MSLIAAFVGAEKHYAAKREDFHAFVDDIDRWALSGAAPLVDHPLVHRWTPGLYIRQITIPSGNLQTTRTHTSKHPFFVLRGRALIRGPEGVTEIIAPFSGITEIGTRRVLFAGYLDPQTGELMAGEDVVWITVHAITPEEEAELDEAKRVEMIERRLTVRHELEAGKTTYELYREGLAALAAGKTAKELA